MAEQEYEAAKEHFREVCKHRVAGNPDHDRRFRDAVEHKTAARDRYVELLTS